MESTKMNSQDQASEEQDSLATVQNENGQQISPAGPDDTDVDLENEKSEEQNTTQHNTGDDHMQVDEEGVEIEPDDQA